jgi:hypothetical protein
MSPDGVSYLDLGDAYWRGDWNAALNAQWNPLYACLIGLVLRVVKPSPFGEFTVVHLTGWLIYLVALACFDFLLRAMISFQRRPGSRSARDEETPLPAWAWLTLGYTLFIWSSLSLISVAGVNPDMLMAAAVYVVSGLILRLRQGHTSWLSFILLGAMLGAGYLAKAPMFPLTFVFLGVSLLAVGNWRRAVPRVLMALVTFLLIAGPLVVALSHSKGRVTFGDSARLNYAWYVSGAPLYIHWQGENPRHGVPSHPTRKILDRPAVYEFATPVGGTYPPWSDPSYWYEGAVPRFDFKQQLRVLISSAEIWWYLGFNLQRGLILFVFLLLYLNRSGARYIKHLAASWSLLIPALVAAGMYSLVNLEPRYVGAFVVLFWLSLLAGVRLPRLPESRRVLAGVTLAMTAVLLIAIGSSLAHDVRKWRGDSAHAQSEVAVALNRLGVQPGDRVASIGDSFRAYWARLARVRIVAEIPSPGPYHEITAGDVDRFWTASERVKTQVMETFARTGAKVIVTDHIPGHTPTPGWIQLGTTDYYAYLLLPPRPVPTLAARTPDHFSPQ